MWKGLFKCVVIVAGYFVVSNLFTPAAEVLSTYNLSQLHWCVNGDAGLMQIYTTMTVMIDFFSLS